ncbi:hypothetical protein [Streptomyces sp. NPDC048650]|uniref:hypothetical protein n=1 Tax=Streptomyces sp. NPDC048650 TaxID=3365583 RepID=UPI00371A14F2
MNVQALHMSGRDSAASVPCPDVTDCSADIARQKVAEGECVLRDAGLGGIHAGRLASYVLLGLFMLRPYWRRRRGTVQVVSLPDTYEWLRDMYGATFSATEREVIRHLILPRFSEVGIVQSIEGQDGTDGTLCLLTFRGFLLAKAGGPSAFDSGGARRGG